MPYRTRTARRLIRKTKRNVIITVFVTVFLSYVILTWALPNFITSVGFITKLIKPRKVMSQSVLDNTTLAPPVLFIPFEATNSAKITITGYTVAGSKVKLYLEDQPKGEITVKDDGSFIAENFELELGNNNIYGKTVDKKGKESLPSKTTQLLYNNEKPNLDLSEPADGIIIHGDKKVKISGKTGSGVQIFINDTRIIVNENGDFSTDILINDGDNNIIIKAIDRATNTTQITRKVIFQS